MKAYTNRQINNSDKGIIYKQPDQTYLVKGIYTKPNGSNSNYLSVGKFSTETDKFGDPICKWEHYDYPNNYKMEGYSFKRSYDGNGAQTSIEWTFIIPQSFLDQGLGIACIGSGQGGKGYRSTDIDVFFDKARIERGTDVIFS